MSARSDFMLGKYVFIKVVTLNRDQATRLAKALVTPNEEPPFTSHEFLFNYLVSNDDSLLNDNIIIFPKYNSLITPKTSVYVSGNQYELDYFDKYKSSEYDDTINEIEKSFIHMDTYLRKIRDLSATGKYIKTALIISETVTGSYDDFIKKYQDSEDFNKIFLDSLVHITYLSHKLQQKYQSVHGDPKTQNYTWLELDQEMDIRYDFRDEYDQSNARIVRRGNVKHLFYLTDMEFVFSPVSKTLTLYGNNYHFNFFTTTASWYGDEWNDADSQIFVPKISDSDLYQSNHNLFGGYFLQPEQDVPPNPTLFNYYPDGYPRMFTVDLLTLIKMLLTYWYADKLNGSNLRKLNIYFTQFVALSFIEENPNRRNEADYNRVSPGTFAELLGAD